MVLPGEYVKHTPLLELFEECHDDEWASRDRSLPISDGKLMSAGRVIPSEHKEKIFSELHKSLDGEKRTESGLLSGRSAQELFGEFNTF